MHRTVGKKMFLLTIDDISLKPLELIAIPILLLRAAYDQHTGGVKEFNSNLHCKNHALDKSITSPIPCNHYLAPV